MFVLEHALFCGMTRFRKIRCTWSCVIICGICNSRWNPVLKALSECDRQSCTSFSWLVSQSKCKSSLSCNFTFTLFSHLPTKVRRQSSSRVSIELCMLKHGIEVSFSRFVCRSYSSKKKLETRCKKGTRYFARRFCTSLEKYLVYIHVCRPCFFSFSFLFHRRGFTLGTVDLHAINRSFFFREKKDQKRAHTNHHWHGASSCVPVFVFVRIHAQLAIKHWETEGLLAVCKHIRLFVMCCVTTRRIPTQNLPSCHCFSLRGRCTLIEERNSLDLTVGYR